MLKLREADSTERDEGRSFAPFSDLFHISLVLQKCFNNPLAGMLLMTTSSRDVPQTGLSLKP